MTQLPDLFLLTSNFFMGLIQLFLELYHLFPKGGPLIKDRLTLNLSLLILIGINTLITSLTKNKMSPRSQMDQQNIMIF